MPVLSLKDIIEDYENQFRENYAFWKDIIDKYNNQLIKYCEDNDYEIKDGLTSTYDEFCVEFLENIKHRFVPGKEFDANMLNTCFLDMVSKKLLNIVAGNRKSARKIVMEKANANIYLAFNNNVNK